MSLAVEVALGSEELLGGELRVTGLTAEVLGVVARAQGDGGLALDRVHAAGALVGVVLGVARLTYGTLGHLVVLARDREGLVTLLALEAFGVLQTRSATTATTLKATKEPKNI